MLEILSGLLELLTDRTALSMFTLLMLQSSQDSWCDSTKASECGTACTPTIDEDGYWYLLADYKIYNGNNDDIT